MPRDPQLKKVMVIGSGPIVIGQAAEFDYAGSQACRALREEGLEVVLVNSNPATIMTDTDMADRVYIEPLQAEFVAQVIRRERPDGLLPTLGGQTGLNLAVELAESGVLDECGVRLLGTPLEAIKKAEDRELFKKAMEAIGEPVPRSAIVSSLQEAERFAREAGLPLIVRPAYTLGGTGGGLVRTLEELREVTARGLKASRIHQVLLEQSVAGWKEIEYEIMRDGADNCITVCNMENIDPMGIHTGDSIVVAPSQTLTDDEYQMLRSAGLRIIRALGIEGGCNIQFALDPASQRYYVIEVNPRVSRSSALASKATGYPIAKVASKIAIGLHLDEIVNAVTGRTKACFEPALDYVVVKIPRWPFDKFSRGERRLGSQMKATGEVMAIDRTLEGALLKAVRSLEIGQMGLYLPELADLSEEVLEKLLREPDDRRLFALAEGFRRNWSVEKVAGLTAIDPFFLYKIQGLVELERALAAEGAQLSPDLLAEAKRRGFSDEEIGRLTGLGEKEVRKRRARQGLRPTYKMVDTCAAEFEASTPYYYSCYDGEDEVRVGERPRVVVLGSGPIRIGQGIEFDYCSVHAVQTIREMSLEAIIINNNPETVSTDFDISDRLYFEPLTPEDVLNVIEKEKPLGVVVQFGGQTALNLAEPLARAGVTILGTSLDAIDAAEDRDRFDRLVVELGIEKPPGRAAFSLAEAEAIAAEIGYPVLVRPSYVLGGRAMEIVYNLEELRTYMASATQVSRRHPVLVDKYLFGTELEVDAVSDGRDVLIAGIMQHVERAGIHSGDSIAVYPPPELNSEAAAWIEEYTIRLARALNVRGLLNIQFVLHGGKIYVLEVNPRASRTVPYLSKITGLPLIKIATRVMLGQTLREQGYGTGLWLPGRYVGVKVPVFSFGKLGGVDTGLGPEMKSTGEVMGIDVDFPRALYKGLAGAGLVVPPGGTILATVADRDKPEAVALLREFHTLGFKIVATLGTARALEAAGVPVEAAVEKVEEGKNTILELLRSDAVQLVINTVSTGKNPEHSGFQLRRAAVEYNVPCLTSLDTAKAVLAVLRAVSRQPIFGLVSLQDLAAAGAEPDSDFLRAKLG